MGSVDYNGYTREYAKRSVGSGWHGLIDRVFDFIQVYPSCKIVQVKEKFGGLRIYSDDTTPEVQSVIDGVEHISFTICEHCGKPGTPTESGWRKTLCDECKETRYTASV